MRDRLPGKPGRVRMTFEDGTEVLVTIQRADEPAVEGSAYNKKNVLPDELCDLLGIDRVASEPKDAFPALLGLAVPPTAYGSDLYLYITGRHPILNAHAYNDYPMWEFKKVKDRMGRNISLTGDAQTIQIYDGGNL